MTDTEMKPAVPGEVPVQASLRFWRPSGFVLVGMVVATIGAIVVMLTTTDRLVVGGMGLLLMLLLILLRVPVAIGLLLPALFGLYALGGTVMVESIMSRTPYTVVASWSLSVIPMFVLMGLLIATSGISQTLYRAAQQWLWWMPGGLAVGTNVAGAGLSAVTGSTLGSTYALARVGIPEMLRMGYDKRISIMAVLAAGLGGQLIPPSILLVIYAGIVQTPIGPQLLAGVVPGVLVAVVFAVIMFLLAILLGQRAAGQSGREHAVPLAVMVKTSARTWPIPVLILVIVGGMFSGVFTATEAGAGAAFLAALYAATKCARSRDWHPMRDAFVGALRSTGMIFLLLIGATFLTQMFTLTGLSTQFQSWVTGIGFTRVTFLLFMVVVYLVLGMFMDTLALMLLTIPVLVPTLEALDISLIFFGVFVVLLCELGMLTPPIGILAFILHGILQDPQVNLGQKITLKDVFVAVGWIMPGALLVIGLLIWFPDIALYLPDAAATSQP